MTHRKDKRKHNRNAFRTRDKVTASFTGKILEERSYTKTPENKAALGKLLEKFICQILLKQKKNIEHPPNRPYKVRNKEMDFALLKKIVEI